MQARTDCMDKPTQDLLLIGDFYDGAYGPTILLALEPERGARWFHRLLTRLARSEGSGLDLVAAPETEIDGIDSFKLGLVAEQPDVALQRVDIKPTQIDFDWNQSASGWTWAAELVASFVKGGAGHHYLSLEDHDAALVEVSYREDLPLRRTFGGNVAPGANESEAGQRQAEQ
jgi:hypothetical protein